MQLIHSQLQVTSGIGKSEATHSIRCEYHKKHPEISGCNAFRKSGAPFSKLFDEDVETIFSSWVDGSRKFPINQAFPDFALNHPFPHKIIFDAKYYVNVSATEARRALVTGVYEVSHYRGLPVDPSGNGWDYDFGCLLAYDASQTGVIKAAWKSVVHKKVFWEGANIYVMIL